MKNPFIVSGYVSAEYFCDRKKESAELLKKVTNGNNLALISSRKMGKTGLIEYCFDKKEVRKNYRTFYVDIYATSNLKEFVFKLGKEIFESLKPKGKKFIDNFFKIISSLRPAFKIDSLTGSPVFDISIGDINKAEFTLEEIFKYLENADKHCLVAIDEFQQIAKYPEKNVEAVLRTHIQRSRNATFIFAGSQRHIMQNIFFSAAQPFYQSVALLTLQAIEKNVYVKFVNKHFNNANKKITSEIAEKVYDIFEGHTWYMQVIFNEIFSFLEQDELFTISELQEIIDYKISSYESLFQSTLFLLSERQKELLYAIAKEGKIKEITSSAFIKKHGLHSQSSTQTSMKQLLDKEVITRENNMYQVYDRFFGLWLRKTFGTGYNLNF